MEGKKLDNNREVTEEKEILDIMRDLKTKMLEAKVLESVKNEEKILKIGLKISQGDNNGESKS